MTNTQIAPRMAQEAAEALGSALTAEFCPNGLSGATMQELRALVAAAAAEVAA